MGFAGSSLRTSEERELFSFVVEGVDVFLSSEHDVKVKIETRARMEYFFIFILVFVFLLSFRVYPA